MNPIKLGLVGFGRQASREYWPYLCQRARAVEDVRIAWISGYLPEHHADVQQITTGTGVACAPLDAWRNWTNAPLSERVDAVVISLPNFLHGSAIQYALQGGLHVAVDKPTTISPEEARTLCASAEEQRLVFSTLSQRRFEDVYLAMAEFTRTGGIGHPRLIHYLMAHSDPDANTPSAGLSWYNQVSKAGGGVLMNSGYHGIDTVLWLLKQLPEKLRPTSVAAQWIRDQRLGSDAGESSCQATVRFDDKCLFSVVISREAPGDSISEHLKLFGTEGSLHLQRDRASRSNRAAPTLVYQSAAGQSTAVDTSTWEGKRWAPLKEFLDVVSAGDFSRCISPASESIMTITLIEAAYRSAERGGEEVLI